MTPEMTFAEKRAWLRARYAEAVVKTLPDGRMVAVVPIMMAKEAEGRSERVMRGIGDTEEASVSDLFTQIKQTLREKRLVHYPATSEFTEILKQAMR